MQKLNSKHYQPILDYIAAYRGERGYAPSIREIGQHIGVASTSQVNYYLNHLTAAGLIRRIQKCHGRL